jgi:hypothetical protein
VTGRSTPGVAILPCSIMWAPIAAGNETVRDIDESPPTTPKSTNREVIRSRRPSANEARKSW